MEGETFRLYSGGKPTTPLVVCAMFNSPTSTKKPSGLVMLMISLVALFAVGCGDSRDEYVYNNLPPASPNTGNLTFQFQQQQANAQQAGIVPIGTTTLQFEFFSTTSGSDTDLVHEDTVAYANQVTITGVPASAVFVRVTAYGAGGAPLATFTGTFEVAIGATTPVDLGTPTAITFDSLGVSPATLALSLAEGGTDSAQLTLVGNFSNGQSVAFPSNTYAASAEFSSSDTEVATVSDSGVVQAVSNGNATITAAYTINGSEVVATSTVTVIGGEVAVDTLTVSPSTLTVARQTESAPLTATFTPAGGTPVDVTGNVTYTLQAPVAGITVNNQTGVVLVDTTAIDNTTAVVVASYNTGNTTVTDTVDVTVGDVFVVSVNAAGGNTLRFPTGAIVPPLFVVTLSNGETQSTFTNDFINGAYYGYRVELSTPSNAALNVTENGRLQFTGSDSQSATFTVSVVDTNVTTTITAINTNDTSYTVDVVPSTTQVSSGEIFRVRTLLNYGNGVVQDITPFISLDWTESTGVELEYLYEFMFPDGFQAYADDGVTGTAVFDDFYSNDLTLPAEPTAFNGATVTIVSTVP